jgi:hypothetical protein
MTKSLTRSSLRRSGWLSGIVAERYVDEAESIAAEVEREDVRKLLEDGVGTRVDRGAESTSSIPSRGLERSVAAQPFAREVPGKGRTESQKDQLFM